MPLVSVFNLRREDRLSELEKATRLALTSMPELAINDLEIDLVPVLRPDDFDGEVTRINVDLWERAGRTKEALQELATRLAKAFQAVAALLVSNCLAAMQRLETKVGRTSDLVHGFGARLNQL